MRLCASPAMEGLIAGERRLVRGHEPAPGSAPWWPACAGQPGCGLRGQGLCGARRCCPAARGTGLCREN